MSNNQKIFMSKEQMEDKEKLELKIIKNNEVKVLGSCLVTFSDNKSLIKECCFLEFDILEGYLYSKEHSDYIELIIDHYTTLGVDTFYMDNIDETCAEFLEKCAFSLDDDSDDFMYTFDSRYYI